MGDHLITANTWDVLQMAHMSYDPFGCWENLGSATPRPMATASRCPASTTYTVRPSRTPTSTGESGFNIGFDGSVSGPLSQAECIGKQGPCRGTRSAAIVRTRSI